jgi:hypothetical protein
VRISPFMFPEQGMFPEHPTFSETGPRSLNSRKINT